MKLVLQITLGILLAGVVTAIINIAYVNYVAYEADRFLEQQAKLLREKVAAQKAAEKQRRIEAFKASYLAEQEKKARITIEQAERQKRDRAWKSYYVTPDECRSFKNDAHMVRCVNHKIDAKKEFDRLYATGEMIIPPPSNNSDNLFNLQ
ncbi:hypothetical protein K0J45_16175 [Shewanella alkalitolerans]|uniref:hypothetical protein n=1 Tax=Shewanella alkalitolerans TaxID=2864209 RepID=UPI001C6621E7|nr:hypothetical protein [Shewanella alkalitolerans]QYJ97033.1 hypothetical protein K0J45_16175 [Shewanella alkalitolerans]